MALITAQVIAMLCAIPTQGSADSLITHLNCGQHLGVEGAVVLAQHLKTNSNNGAQSVGSSWG